tara:strand:- start:635 stop:838 length:204 start_codon:yes stop_codon:yes gene_type:complete
MKKESETEKWGKRIGFVIMYFIFFNILYFILKITHRLPESNAYITISLIALTIVLLGTLIKYWLRTQ